MELYTIKRAKSRGDELCVVIMSYQRSDIAVCICDDEVFRNTNS